VTDHITRLGGPDSGFGIAPPSVADMTARLHKDWAAYAQAKVRLAEAFHGLDREIVNLSEKLGGNFLMRLGDETRYDFEGLGGKHLTIGEWVHGKLGLGRRAAATAGVLGVAIGALSAVEAAREPAGGKSFMAAMQNVTNPISRVVQGLTIASVAAGDATHSLLEKTGVIQSATPAEQVGVAAARGLRPANDTQATRKVAV